MKYAVLALFLSHGLSYVNNFILKGEYTRKDPATLMGEPYARIFVMHIAIIAGAFLSQTLGSPIGILLILILLKTAIDIKLHLKQHKTN
jgi:hypothetical protein